MNTTQKPPRDELGLEQYIGKLLRAQPLRQAPASLTARIERQLALQGARPWWLQGFSAWPWLARIVFALVSAGLVALAYVTTDRLSWISQALQQSSIAGGARASAQMFANLGHAVQLLGEHGSVRLALRRSRQSALLLYAALFGLGAAAFRTLFEPAPEPVRY